MQSKPEIPEGTTHVWLPMFEKKPLGFSYMTVTVLGFYKFNEEESEWYVYSDVTGWRKSGNSSEWFAREITEGYFVSVEEWYAKSSI